MNKIFDYLQYLIIPFTIAAIFFIAYGSFLTEVKSMDDIGTGVLCMGIAFAFGSMGDITKVSAKDKKLFNNRKKYRRFIIIYSIFGFLTLLVCLLFISMRWAPNKVMGPQYYNLGLNLFPCVIAVFFTIKQTQDKKQYYELQQKKQGKKLK